MNKEIRPAFMLYASDWLSGTADLSMEEKGIFMDMLCQQWLRGDLPNDMGRLCRMFGGDANRNAIASILHKFRICENGNLQNAKLEQVRQSSAERKKARSDTNSENAIKGWEKRRANSNEGTLLENEFPIDNDASRNAIAMQMESESISENESENEDKLGGVGGNLALAKIQDRKPSFQVHEAAARLQEIYSKRQGKPENLRRAYAQAMIKMAGQPWCYDYDFSRKRIETAAAKCMVYHVRAATETQFIPFPENWLEGGEWETDWDAATKEVKLSEKKNSEELAQGFRKVKQL
jgi:uncharacterized protein YdaU (DUF1376 family)